MKKILSVILTFMCLDGYGQAQLASEENAELINILINLATINKTISETGPDGAQALREYYYHHGGDEHPASFLSYGDQSTTIITNIITVFAGVTANHLIKSKDSSVFCGAYSLASASAVTLRESSPSFHLSILGDTEKKLIDEAKKKQLTNARNFAKHVGIMLQLDPKEEKLLSNSLYKHLMEIYYTYGTVTRRDFYGTYTLEFPHYVDSFDVLKFLKSKSIAVKKIAQLEEFQQQQTKLTQAMKDQAQNSIQDAKMIKQQMENLKKEKNQIETIIQLIEATEAYNTDPKLQKTLNDLKTRIAEIQENYLLREKN